MAFALVRCLRSCFNWQSGVLPVPSANGPDLYVEESCPQGTFIRAMTAEGREIWRRRMGDPASTLPAARVIFPDLQPGKLVTDQIGVTTDNAGPGRISMIASEESPPIDAVNFTVDDGSTACRVASSPSVVQRGNMFRRNAPANIVPNTSVLADGAKSMGIAHQHRGLGRYYEERSLFLRKGCPGNHADRQH